MQRKKISSSLSVAKRAAGSKMSRVDEELRENCQSENDLDGNAEGRGSRLSATGKVILRSSIAEKKQHRYFKDWETQLTEDEFKKRKSEYFLGRLFYKRLCNLVTRIEDFQGASAGSPEKEERMVKLKDEITKKKEDDEKKPQKNVSKHTQATQKKVRSRDRSDQNRNYSRGSSAMDSRRNDVSSSPAGAYGRTLKVGGSTGSYQGFVEASKDDSIVQIQSFDNYPYGLSTKKKELAVVGQTEYKVEAV